MSDNTNFVHLHIHSDYSIFESTAKIKDIVDEAVKMGMSAVALTDKSNMSGAIEFYNYAKKCGIKPIIGIEINVDSEQNRLLLLAIDDKGYRNLLKLSSPYLFDTNQINPMVNFNFLKEYSEGLIALYVGLHSEISNQLLNNQKHSAISKVELFQKVFGKQNLFIELQNHNLSEELKIIHSLVELARECDCPVVATNNVHYIKSEESESLNVFFKFQSTEISNKARAEFLNGNEFYLKSAKEMAEVFSEWPDAISNTLTIANRCNLDIQFGKKLIPVAQLSNGKSADNLLVGLCQKSLVLRYGSENPDEVVINRLAHELETIKHLGLSEYFLLFADIIKATERLGIRVGPGRGRTPGSIVAYLLEITDVDPIKHGLFFEPFLANNPFSVPDIFLDISKGGREKLIGYLTEKFGKHKVAKIITFDCLTPAFTIKKIGKLLNMTPAEINPIVEIVSSDSNRYCRKNLTDYSALAKIRENGNEHQKKLLKLSSGVSGRNFQTGLHACGIIASPTDLVNSVPLSLDDQQNLFAMYDSRTIEHLEVLKLDFLEFRYLNFIQNTLEIIKNSLGIDLNLGNATIKDQKVLNLLQNGITRGIYGLEVFGISALLLRMRSPDQEDLTALLSSYRPGPLMRGTVDEFIERQNGQKKITYPHPALNKILKETYGIYLYQEQIMQTATTIAGFSLSEANSLRKILGKRITEQIEPARKQFIERASALGFKEKIARSIFEIMAEKAEFTTYKSHYAAYSLITTQTAWLKANYPKEFIAAVMMTEPVDEELEAIFCDECIKLDICFPQ